MSLVKRDTLSPLARRNPRNQVRQATRGVARGARSNSIARDAPATRVRTRYASDAAWRRRVRAYWSCAATAWERWHPTLLHSLASVDPALLRALDLAPG